MAWFSGTNSKRLIIAVVALLVCCDFTLLFAAQAQNNDETLLRQLQQLQQGGTAQPTDTTSQQTTTQQPATNQTQQLSNLQNQIRQLQQEIIARRQQAGNNGQAQTTGQATTTTQQMVTAAPSTASEAAFQTTAQDALPMQPNQIVRLRQMYDATQFAVAASPGTPPKPIATSQFVSLEPGATPPVIRLAQGFVSSLVFLDSTGAPWPITAYDLGDLTSFNIQWDKKSNMLMIQASKLYNYGNLAIRLKNLSTPVMLTLIPGQTAVDYRVDLRIQGLGPNANPLPMGQGMPDAVNPVLLSVLDGVAPPGSQVLSVSGGDAKAWSQGSDMYLRTRYTVLSPGWLATVNSADGLHVYKMQKTPVVLASNHGRLIQLKIEGL